MWRLEEHTADVSLAVEGASWAELLCEAARCFGEFIGGGPHPAGPRREAALEVEGGDVDETWVRYWRGLHRLWAVEGLLAIGARIEAESTPLHARVHVSCVSAETLDASRCTDVKAVTWHRAEVAASGALWRGRIVLDV